MTRLWLTPLNNIMPSIDDFFDFSRDFNAYPPINMYEKDNKLFVEVKLSGYNPDNIDLAIKEGNLILRGRVSSQKTDKEKKYFVKEIVERSFERVIPLPYDVLEDKAEAEYKNGVLLISLPKKSKEEKRGIIPIKIRK